MQAFKVLPLGPVFPIHSLAVGDPTSPEIVVCSTSSAPRNPAGQVISLVLPQLVFVSSVSKWAGLGSDSQACFFLSVASLKKGPELGVFISLISFHPFRPPFHFLLLFCLFSIDPEPLSPTKSHRPAHTQPHSTRHPLREPGGAPWCRPLSTLNLTTNKQTNRHDAFPHRAEGI